MLMDIERFIIEDNIPISEAVKKIDEGRRKVVFCVHDGVLTGSFTDGDMRRYILKDGDMQKPVSVAMNPDPFYIRKEQIDKAEYYLEKKNYVAIPAVDSEKRIVSISFRDENESIPLSEELPEEVRLVINAGGKGTRLYPYTRILPKPLIPIGDMPIMDHIISRFSKAGIDKISIIVNHKKNMVKAYYNEMDKPNNISFVEEDEFLGTGGGLSLLKGELEKTFFFSNCDCILNTDYRCIYDFHKQHENAITIIVAAKTFDIPYGVIDLEENGSIEAMREKPEYNFFVNTGIYIIEPFVLDYLAENEKIDMPDLVQRIKDEGFHVGGYPVTEKSWLDMGQFSEMQSMLKELGLQ